MAARVGIDLVAVDSVRGSLEAHGERYLRRVYTASEVEDCRGPDGAVSAERLAGRFAAKEATLKALGVARDEGVPWPSIEVVRDDSGRVELQLTGRAAALAAERGIGSLAVSITHESPLAAAVVVAEQATAEWLPELDRPEALQSRSPLVAEEEATIDRVDDRPE